MKKPTATKPAHLRFAILATDIALFTIHEGSLLVRVVKVDRPPYFKNSKGLPGGLIEPRETAHEAAQRHIQKKSGIDPDKIYVEQLYTFSDIDRDPRGRVVAVAYLGLVPWEKLSAAERADTDEAWWSEVGDAKRLAYDHDEILLVALVRLRSRATYTTLAAKLLPREFTLTELEQIYESILGKNLDKRNFRKKILNIGVLAPLPHKKTGGRYRPAQLYRFASDKVREVEML